MHPYNAKIATAMMYVNTKSVHHNLELKLYTVVDAKQNPYQVTLLPKASCSCGMNSKKKKEECAHILAVRHLNGQNITDLYKVPTLSNLVKKKNSGASGRKRRGI